MIRFPSLKSVAVTSAIAVLAGFAPLSAGSAAADDAAAYTLVIKDHMFQPAELEVPTGQKIKLTVRNEDPTPEEFESHDLHREKIIPGGGQVTVVVGPLKAGTYEFVGEFHEDTAKGKLVAH